MNSTKPDLRTGEQPPRKNTNITLIAVLAAVVLALAIWAFVSSDPVGEAGTVPSAEVVGEQANETTGEINGETNDVDTVTDEAAVPVEDANPNPVVPQDAVIPPAPVDDTPTE
ncbi:hypothetical protein [Sulfitobacter guttiformis]|uniref:Uncharacterized protein n=1 Tax=Sulfitobacter guttiformis TaxID=74349 RepID=A0A420DJ31_9RHOB|nr:hypothetical protein [Sulfitobacter guttiformis]KIN71943.1 hypothetical protein Z949_1109 [Sulfitobacter guttiformis KCTC 32187]RKE94256.1 hypothetical protein C8N30_3374 [Sulfitobacter guttiformis]